MTRDDHNLESYHLDMLARSFVNHIDDISKEEKIVNITQLMIIGIYDIKSDGNG